MKARNILSALLLLVAGIQSAAAQGFRVYKSDGTVAQFSLRTDSIVFYDGIGSDADFGPFTPVNQCIVGTWYMSKSETVTFNENGTTDFIADGTYRFFPYQGSIVIYNASGVPVNIFKVHNVADGTMIVSTLDGSFRVWGATPQPQPVTSIALSESAINLKVNETKTLTVSIPEDAGSKEVIWKSSDTGIATVDQSGKVTAVAKGSCLITVMATDGSGKSASCAVTVVQPVTSVSLNKTSITLPTGTSQTLTATVMPSNASNKKVTWKSSNTAVASVDQSGKVTAIGQGSCTVTATASDGSGKKAECSVTVVKLVSGITLNKTSLTLFIGAKDTLIATVAPFDATNRAIAWESSDESVATIDQTGALASVALGSCVITCRATDGSNVYAECQLTVDHEWVDLGLPSGTLWATYNVGATKPEEYGNYYAWGETTPKENYGWGTYKWCNGSESTLTKYCTKSSYGTVDDKTELEAEDDAATVNWGSNWQMPSVDQMNELINSSYVNISKVTQDDVYGCKITSRTNGNSIFLPAGGLYEKDTSLIDAGKEGHYWSRTLSPSNSKRARRLSYDYGAHNTEDNRYRNIGLNVRPVRKQ